MHSSCDWPPGNLRDRWSYCWCDTWHIMVYLAKFTVAFTIRKRNLDDTFKYTTRLRLKRRAEAINRRITYDNPKQHACNLQQPRRWKIADHVVRSDLSLNPISSCKQIELLAIQAAETKKTRNLQAKQRGEDAGHIDTFSGKRQCRYTLRD